MFRFKEILNEKGITQNQLAEKMKVSPQYVSGLVREVETPSINTLVEISKLLEVPIYSLFDDYKSSVIECPHCGRDVHIRIVAE